MEKIQEAAAALIKRQGRYLLAQRKEDDSYPDLWEFPGGGIKVGEKIRLAAEREIKEELGLTVKAKDVLAEFWDQNHKVKIKIFLVSCQILKGKARPKDCQDFGFFSLAEAERLNLAPADRKIFNYLKRSRNEARTT